MGQESIYLLSIWAIQIILYSILTFEIFKWKVSKRTICWIAVGLFLIAPWLFPVNGEGYDPESGEYICGLSSLLPISIFWILGNGGNLILILVFAAIGQIKKKLAANEGRQGE